MKTRTIFSQATAAISLIAIGLAGSGSAIAQDRNRDRSIDNLPRPGYEPRNINIGGTILEPTLSLDATYDNNVYATSANEEDDAIFRIAPSLRASREMSKVRVEADVYASILRFADHKRENAESFGAETNIGYIGDPQHTANLSVRYDRTFERRTDPEANPDLSLKPSNIDVVDAEYSYRYKPGRIGVGASAGISKVDYRSAQDADRDLTTYRAAIRGIYQLSGKVDLFVEGYGNFRDARLPFDRNGIDRDTTTWGGTLGASVAIADRLTGEMGIGYFNANPEDPRTPNFSGVSANGRITWRPRIRTAVSLDVFRGNVATIRSGATGRIDTRVGLRVDQEVRHNLIARAGVSMRDTSYRGAALRDQTNWGGDVGGEWLLNRFSAITFNLSYMKRTAEQRLDKFDKFMGTVGVRLRF